MAKMRGGEEEAQLAESSMSNRMVRSSGGISGVRV